MRLRYLIFLAFLAVSWVPVMLFTAWSYRSEYRKELTAVEEKHLLLSEHVTRALARYVTDVEVVFRTLSDDMAVGRRRADPEPLLAGMHMRHVCLIDGNARIVERYCAGHCPPAVRLPEPLLARLAPLIRHARSTPGEVLFSGAMRNGAGQPAIYTVRAWPDGRFALGELSNAYLAELQSSISFGTKGHAAIVDGQGRVLAHPRSTWVREQRDLSSVDVVQRMRRGESGVVQFYSPAVDAMMVAGFAPVPKVGWGVMVPQPLAELESKARDVGGAALALGLFALIATGLASWFLASFMDRWLKPVVEAARRNAAGEIGAEAVGLPDQAPRELRELVDAFNDMARRISEAFRNERQALLVAREAQDTSDAKSQFMAQVSHEFRTPLNAILGFSEVIRDEMFGPVGDRYRDYADSVHRSGRHLLGLIDNVIDISRADLGQTEPREEWVALRELIDDAAAMVSEAYRGDAHDRLMQVRDDLPRVFVDRQMFRQILINLLSNAEKFTPAGGRIVVGAMHHRDGRMEIAVSDTGIGIAPEDIGQALAPFGRVTSAATLAKPGTGLGLTLVKSLTEMHGGTLRIDSVVGTGTTVRVLLPADRVESPAATVVKLEPSSKVA